MGEPAEREFPQGSVIVKEKLEAGELLGLGMMRKDAPEAGGWQFAYWEASELYEGVPELEVCRQCHATGEVPAVLDDVILSLGLVREQIVLPEPRDSVFLTLPR
jgi:hypothetical protein